MASSYNRATGATDSFTTGTLAGVVSGSDHGNKADAINKVQAQVVKEAPLNVNWPEYGGNIATAITALPATGASLYIPAGQYTGAFDFATKSHLTVMGDGSTSTIHNTTASDHALSFTDCPNLIVKDLRVQGTSGTFDGLHLERCHRSTAHRVYCQGSGRYGVYAEECIGVDIDAFVGIDVASPYPTGVTNCTIGVFLNWDGVNADSGCNQFKLDGWYVLGKAQSDWAVKVVRAEGGLVNGRLIPELTKSGILLESCQNIVLDGFYGESNPSDVEYFTGTCSVTNGSAAVTGSGTAWNTNDAEGQKNAMAGKSLVVNGTAARVLSIGSDTALTLEENWPAATASGASYTLIGTDLMLLSCNDCSIVHAKGAGVMALRGSNRTKFLGALTNYVAIDGNSSFTRGSITTHRTGSNSREKYLKPVVPGSQNWVTQLNYQTGAVVRYGPEDVKAPTFENSWVNEGSGTYNDAGYWRDGEGFVNLRGRIKTGTMAATAFTLPAGYRPLKEMNFPVLSNAAFGSVRVYAAGWVVPIAGSNASFDLDGISFRTTD